MKRPASVWSLTLISFLLRDCKYYGVEGAPFVREYYLLRFEYNSSSRRRPPQRQKSQNYIPPAMKIYWTHTQGKLVSHSNQMGHLNWLSSPIFTLARTLGMFGVHSKMLIVLCWWEQYLVTRNLTMCKTPAFPCGVYCSRDFWWWVLLFCRVINGDLITGESMFSMTSKCISVTHNNRHV